MTEDMRIVFDPLRAGHEMLFIEDHRLVAVHRCGGIEMDIGLGHRRAQKFCLLLTNICYRGGYE